MENAKKEKKQSPNEVFRAVMKKRFQPVELGIVDIQRANDYIPLMTKGALAKMIAPACIEPVKIQADDGTPLPDRYQENPVNKARGLMGVFIRYYLNIEFDGWAEDILIPANIYDKYAGSHIFSQIEKMKSVSACRDKIFNILGDYKQFTSMLNGEIFSQLSNANDAVGRMQMAMSTGMSPEALSEAMNALEETARKIEELKGEKANGADIPN